MRALTIALLLATACGGNDHKGPQDAGVTADATPDASCFDNPQTHNEIINACTTAQKIYKDSHPPLLDADGTLCGVTRFMRMNEAHRRLEIGGTVYAPRVQRTGVNTETKLLLLTHAFETLGCQCVQLRTDWLNHASRRAIERLGAKQDGVLRGHMVMEGRLRDTVVYSILAHEWPGVRRNLATRLAAHEGSIT